MASNIDPTIINRIANEMVALEEGSAPLEAELKQELGRLSFTTTVIQEKADSMESSTANFELVKDFCDLLPRAAFTPGDSSSFNLNPKGADAQYQARKLQANILWLPGRNNANGLDSPDRLHPVYIIGRRENSKSPDVTELLVSPNRDMIHSYWDMGARIIKVRKDDLKIRDGLVAASEAKDYPEDTVREMIMPDGTFRVDAETPGSFRISRSGRGKSSGEAVQARGIRFADRDDTGTALKYGISNNAGEKFGNGIPTTIMEEFDVGPALAKLAQDFNVSDGLARLLKQTKDTAAPSQAEAASDEAGHPYEAFTAQNRELKHALAAALAASGLFSEQEVRARIEERFPDLNADK